MSSTLRNNYSTICNKSNKMEIKSDQTISLKVHPVCSATPWSILKSCKKLKKLIKTKKYKNNPKKSKNVKKSQKNV